MILDRIRASTPRLARLKRFARLLQPAAAVALLAFMAAKLGAIGWTNLAPPATPWFYAALFALYLVPPLADFTVYRALWGLSSRAFPVFLKKRLYNEVLLDYSGEVYLYAWAKRAMGLRPALFASIRDVNILSGIVSNVATLLLAGAAAAAGLDLLKPDDAEWLLLSCGVTAIITVVVLSFARRFFSLPSAMVVRIAALHAGRLAGVLTLYAVAWSAALPAVSFVDWLPVLAAQMLLTRLPFLPNRELLIAWLGMSLAPLIDAGAADVAATFASAAAVMLILHALVYAGSALTSLTRPLAPAVPHA